VLATAVSAEALPSPVGRKPNWRARTQASTKSVWSNLDMMTSSDTETERLEVALRCASNGIPVVPLYGLKTDGKCRCSDEECPTPGKHPRAEATTDAAMIKEYWEKWPKAKAAVAIGAPDIIAVKLKLTGVGRPDEPWSRRPDKWAELQKKFGVPRTVIFSSKNQDVLLFTVPKEDVPIGVLAVEEGVTVYGAGEYLPLPQSLDPSGKLAFQPTCGPDQVEIAEAPDWVRRMVIFTTLRDRNINTGFDTLMIPFDMIAHPGVELDDERVKLHAESLQVTSLRTLLYVRSVKGYQYLLLSDPHELAALELLGFTSALSVVLALDDDEAELWQISQVLNQRKLSALDWAETVMRWVELVKRREAQGAQPIGGPHNKGFSRVGRVLGVSRRDVQRAAVIASICAEAKAEIRRLNLNVRRKLLAIGAEPEELQLRKLYELTRDLKSESADETDSATGSEPGDGGEHHAEANQGPGGSALGQAAANLEVVSTITLQSPEDAEARQAAADQEPGACSPEEVAPKEPASPAMAAKALIASPSITGGADGDDPTANSSKDFDALDLALDHAWDQHCAPINDRLPDVRRRRFIERKLGYVVVAPGGVDEGHAEAGPQDEAGA
jgi:Bifunctional DNA primase/polymerase, N-terminal